MSWKVGRFITIADMGYLSKFHAELDAQSAKSCSKVVTRGLKV